MLNVAVVGATGIVGETILRVLYERALPIGSICAFASRARSGAVRFGDTKLDVRATNLDDLAANDVVFFAGAEDAGKQYVPALVEHGCVVIDNSPAFRMDRDVPLIVPEINADVVSPQHRLFPVANCTAIILCVALAPIRAVAGLRSVRVATYQAASGAGRRGLEELLSAQRALSLGEPEPDRVVFEKSPASNVIAQIGTVDAGGYSSEERKICSETRKMLGIADLLVSATAVRVPVRTAHCEAVFVETQRPTSVAALTAALQRAAGIVFGNGIPTPRDVEGSDLVHVARLRAECDDQPTTHFAFWCVGDQLRKGAATNAVQILQLLLHKGYVRA